MVLEGTYSLTAMLVWRYKFIYCKLLLLSFLIVDFFSLNQYGIRIIIVENGKTLCASGGSVRKISSEVYVRGCNIFAVEPGCCWTDDSKNIMCF